jgi:hypothetical protein
LRECNDAVNRVENEDADHSSVKDPPAPDSVVSNDAQNEQSNRYLARCKAKDYPWLCDPVNSDSLTLLLWSEVKQVPETTDGGVVG